MGTQLGEWKNQLQNDGDHSGSRIDTGSQDQEPQDICGWTSGYGVQPEWCAFSASLTGHQAELPGAGSLEPDLR